MRLIILSIIFLLSQHFAAYSQGCAIKFFKTYMVHGEMTTLDGDRYQVAGQDFIDPSEWRPKQKLLICKDVKDSKRLNTEIYRIKNLARGETLVVYKRDERWKD